MIATLWSRHHQVCILWCLVYSDQKISDTPGAVGMVKEDIKVLIDPDFYRQPTQSLRCVGSLPSRQENKQPASPGRMITTVISHSPSKDAGV